MLKYIMNSLQVVLINKMLQVEKITIQNNIGTNPKVFKFFKIVHGSDEQNNLTVKNLKIQPTTV